MNRPFHWGIIGLGKIARKFAQDVQVLENATLHAVASRTQEKADAFAQEYAASYAYGSYEALMQCPDLDAIYIATPHVFHYENTVLCLQNKIPVLCEKPFAMNIRQVEEMIRVAKEQDTFLMEALWTRFLPTTLKMLELMENNAIGEVLSVKADFGFKAPLDPEKRIFNQKLGGGSLLDIGIYPVFLALLTLGYPDTIEAIARIGSTKVEEECGMLFNYENGRMAHLHSTVRAKTNTEAFIYGEKGTIHLHSRWHEPTSMSLTNLEGEEQHFDFEWKSNGYHYEAEEVMECLAAGKKESDRMPLDFSLQLIRLLDAVREKAGIHYPDWDEWKV